MEQISAEIGTEIGTEILRQKLLIWDLGRAGSDLGRDFSDLGRDHVDLDRDCSNLVCFVLARLFLLSRACVIAPKRPSRGLILKCIVLAPKHAKIPTKTPKVCVDIYTRKVALNKYKEHNLRLKHACGKGKTNYMLY